MTLRFQTTREEAESLVIRALQATAGIQTVRQSRYQIIGDAGTFISNKQVVVEFSDPTADGIIEAEVVAENSSLLNVIGSTSDLRRRFLTNLGKLREQREQAVNYTADLTGRVI